MIHTTFVGKSKDPIGEIKHDVDLWQTEIKKEIDILGEATAQNMKDAIIANKKRPQSNEIALLENTIDVEYFENGWGVGDIGKLKVNAPWWAAFNFGSSHMVGKHLPQGTFQPGVPNPTNEDFRGGRWKKDKYGSLGGALYSPIVKKPIPATNFIEKTIFWLNAKFAELRG